MILLRNSTYREGHSAFVRFLQCIRDVDDLEFTFLDAIFSNKVKIEHHVLHFRVIHWICRNSTQLSHWIVIGRSTIMPNFERTKDSQSSLAVVKAMLWNLTFVLDRATADCLCDNHKIKVFPSIPKYQTTWFNGVSSPINIIEHMKMEGGDLTWPWFNHVLCGWLLV